MSRIAESAFGDQPYPLTPGHRGVATSIEAAHSMKAGMGQLHARIVAFVQGRGEHGATQPEIAEGLALSRQTVSGRVRELDLGGKLFPTKRRRIAPSGRSAAVYVTQGFLASNNGE